MGGAYSACGGGEAYTVFWWGNLKESHHFGDLDVDWRIILRWIFRMWDVGAWTGVEVAQGKDRLRAVVNAVMSLRVA